MARGTQLFSLQGKIIVVTGGAGLYGRQIVRALADAGGTVVAVSRNVEQLDSVCTELRALEVDVQSRVCDLTSEDQILALRDSLVQDFGRLDVLFNNAVSRAGRGMFEMSGQEWEETMHLNSTGLFLCCKHLSEPMCRFGKGSIINVASIYGMVGPDLSIYQGTDFQNPANYSFSKGGMISFTRYLAAVLGPCGVRVNCLSPGGLLTPETPPRFVQQYSRRTLLGRMAGEDDLKGAAIFFASDASSYITGVNLPVDGGWTAI